jgi:hypothetical protein
MYSQGMPWAPRTVLNMPGARGYHRPRGRQHLLSEADAAGEILGNDSGNGAPCTCRAPGASSHES